MEYGVIGTSDQSDTKDGLEELCPVCGDKEWLFYHAHPLFEETRLFLHTRYTAKIKRQGFSCTPVIRPTWRYKVFHAHPLYVLFEETKFFLHTRYTANMKRQGFSCTSVMLWRRCFFAHLFSDVLLETRLFLPTRYTTYFSRTYFFLAHPVFVIFETRFVLPSDSSFSKFPLFIHLIVRSWVEREGKSGVFFTAPCTPLYCHFMADINH